MSGIPGVPTIYYGASNGAGLDGEGRITQVTASSGTSPVTGVTYSTTSTTNPLGALTAVTFGSADSDSFTYDPNTGRMGTYTFSVNGQTNAGALTWNTNGTLQKMVINDQIPGTSDSQTCNYLYDDLQRVSTSNCGALWTQNFTYDAFGNIQKNVPTGDSGLTFLPTYSATQNQFTSIPGVSVSYDQNGNLLTDNINTYTWDPNWGTMTTVSNGSTTVTSTYDAMGRMVENNAGGSYTEFVYGPTGKLAKCNGQTLVKAFVALPGGAKAIYTSAGLAYYRHSDWLGSSRLTSTASRTLYSSSAYAPFGEQYSTSGTTDASFTGQDQDTVSSLYDFPARRQSPSQGRWISPDPAGLGAVMLTNPQSWNRYAYVLNNPLALTDPAGLSARHRRERTMGAAPLCGDDDDDDDDTGGCGGGDDDDDNSGNPPPPDCLFISAGINTTPTNSGGLALENFANANGDVDVAMPYGSGLIAGAASVLQQAATGPNSATINFTNALSSVTANNSNVTLVLFSGSAQAFNTALSNGMVNQNELDSIAQIIYVSPGSPGGFGNPTYTGGSPIPTAYYDGGQGFADTFVLGWNPDGTQYTDTGCSHNLVCELSAVDSDGDPAIGELPPNSDCAPGEGDFGGNNGPLDPGSPDQPALRRHF